MEIEFFCNRSLRRAAAVFLAIVSLGSARPSDAAPFVRVTFSGTVTSLTDGLSVPGTNVGDPVTGSPVCDAGALDGQPLDWIGNFQNAIKRLDLTVGSKSFSIYAPPLATTTSVTGVADANWKVQSPK